MLSDRDLIPILESNMLIEELSIRNCSSITITSIHAIANTCPNLKLLDVVGIRANCSTILGVLGQSTPVRESLQVIQFEPYCSALLA